MPETTPDPSALPGLVDKALAMTEERIARAPGQTMYTSIRNQLRFMRDTLAAGRAPTIDEKNRLTLGVIAARELETTDPDYADVLFDTVFLFKKL